MATKSIRGYFCVLIFAAAVLLIGTVPRSLAEEISARSTGPTKTAEVTVEKKTKAGLLTKELRLVLITRHTQYSDPAGKKVAFESLAAPCKAVVVYEPEPKGDHVAVSVTVREYLPGATSRLARTPE